MRARLSSWPWILGVWTGVGLINASQTVFPMRALGMHHAWMSLFATLVVVWLPWALATPWVARLGRRYPPIGRTAPLAWVIHLAAMTTIGLIYAAWSATLEIVLNPWAQTPPPGPFTAMWLSTFVYGQLSFVVLYAFILTIDYMFESRQRIARQQTEAAQLNEQLHKAQLDALRHQIEPHFMFNSLKHGISKRAQGGAIRVSATSSEGTLTLRVENDGPDLSPDWETRRTGIGISNLHTRLRLLYGAAFDFRLHNRDRGGVQAIVSVPLVET
jgi:sensor histidine kinase YesM